MTNLNSLPCHYIKLHFHSVSLIRQCTEWVAMYSVLFTFYMLIPDLLYSAFLLLLFLGPETTNKCIRFKKATGKADR